jgi:hypothetical protein
MSWRSTRRRGNATSFWRTAIVELLAISPVVCVDCIQPLSLLVEDVVCFPRVLRKFSASLDWVKIVEEALRSVHLLGRRLGFALSRAWLMRFCNFSVFGRFVLAHLLCRKSSGQCLRRRTLALARAVPWSLESRRAIWWRMAANAGTTV